VSAFAHRKWVERICLRDGTTDVAYEIWSVVGRCVGVARRWVRVCGGWRSWWMWLDGREKDLWTQNSSWRMKPMDFEGRAAEWNSNGAEHHLAEAFNVGIRSTILRRRKLWCNGSNMKLETRAHLVWFSITILNMILVEFQRWWFVDVERYVLRLLRWCQRLDGWRVKQQTPPAPITFAEQQNSHLIFAEGKLTENRRENVMSINKWLCKKKSMFFLAANTKLFMSL
jgi:hypothetical protein